MRHLEIKDLWLQKEVGEKRVKVWKIPGDKNPADLMTKNLKIEEIRSRLLRLGLVIEWLPNRGRHEVADVKHAPAEIACNITRLKLSTHSGV